MLVLRERKPRWILVDHATGFNWPENDTIHPALIHWNDISMRLVGLCLSWSSCIWQIYTSETLKQAEGVVSTVRCEGREHALGRGIKRKLDSIHSMHSTLHEDQDGQYCMTVLLDINRIRVDKVFPCLVAKVFYEETLRAFRVTGGRLIA